MPYQTISDLTKGKKQGKSYSGGAGRMSYGQGDYGGGSDKSMSMGSMGYKLGMNKTIEDAWRFLKAAIDEWLRAQDSRTVLLQQAGVFSDDETLDDLRQTIYAARGRPETESS